MATGLPTIQGIAEEDQTLTANTSAISDDDGLGAFSYQWMRGGTPISGATSSTYTLSAADVGSKMSVSVSFVDAYSTLEGPLASSATATVTQNIPIPIAIVAPPSVTMPPPAEKAQDVQSSAKSESTTKESTLNSTQEKSSNDGAVMAPTLRPPQDGSKVAAEATVGLSVVELLSSDNSTDSEKENISDASGQTGNGVREHTSNISQSLRITQSDSGRDSTPGFGTSLTFVGQMESADYTLLTKPGAMWDQLDNYQESVESQIQGDLIVVGTAGAAASGFTVGLVAWAVRSGFLLSGLVAQIPAWRGIDPLLIMQGGMRGENGETLEELMDRQSKAIEEDIEQETSQ